MKTTTVIDITPSSNSTNGWINGFIGVFLFSGSMPATKVAVIEMDPLFVTASRAGIAGVLALICLLIFKEIKPTKAQLLPLGIVAIGGVIGFPLLSALALQYITSAHSLVYLGILPMCTAVFAVIRGGEKPKGIFWLFSILGSLLVIGFAVLQGGTSSPLGNILMIIAILLCGLSYAEGAKLSKSLGGWQVISWAVVLSLPISLPIMFITAPATPEFISIDAWIGVAYLGVFSMFVGFIFWYKGLAQGGIASVGQLQLLQPFFGLALAAYLLNEHVSSSMILVTLGVILCVAGSKKFG
ncbi:DMT family transporter [Myroides albus]|uniref:EamA family transporter n=1 Tax=Myroides albus TaxID=2562892 RepID=A0A6I3LLT6_9FLAO|nr:DMT family transporter [Myroides albus]MTG99323.1 EamA family transporter [Myroides albus]UVD80034.1 DMT family transporter [Myroides albus]